MKFKPKANAIAQLLVNRVAAIEAIVIAMIFGLAINLLSGLVADYLKGSDRLILSISLALLVWACLWVWRRVSQEMTSEETWEGVIGLEPESNNPINLIIYPFSQCIYRYIQAVFKGDPELLASWKSAKISSNSPQVIASQWYGRINKGRRSNTEQEQSTVAQLVREATEAYIFSIISDSLLDYSKRAKGVKWKAATSEQFREISKGNRILAKIWGAGGADHAGASYALSAQGAMYMSPQLYLPDGSQLHRLPSGSIALTTKRIRIEFSAGFSGARHYEAPEFASLYLNRDPQATDLYKVTVRSDLTILSRGLLDFGQWWEQGWMDFLLNEFRVGIDFDDFKERINFDSALFNLRLHRVTDLNSRKSAAE